MHQVKTKKMHPANYTNRAKRFRITLTPDGGCVLFSDLKQLYGTEFMAIVRRLESYFTLKCLTITGNYKSLKCCKIDRKKGVIAVRRFGAFQIMNNRFGLADFYVHSIIPHGQNLNDNMRWQATLRPNQIAIVQHLNDVVFADERAHVGGGGCILKLEAGFGKSFIAAKLIHLIGKKTAIVVHSISMLDQWQKVIAACYGDTLSVGKYYGAKKIDGDVVILVINSASNAEFEIVEQGKKKMIPAQEYWAQFGFIVWDEVHLYANRTGGRAITRASATFMLGLSATPDENLSGFDPAVWWGCGPVVDAMELAGVEIEAVQFSAVVHKISYAGPPTFTRRLINRYTGTCEMAATINMICEDARRSQVILNCINDCIRRNLYTFVFAGRRGYLEDLRQLLISSRRTLPEHVSHVITDEKEFVRLVGGAKAADMQEAEQTSRVIFTTYAFFGVGRSIPKMTGCVLATPRRNKMRQYIGRILRRGSDLTTVRHIYDIVDSNLSIKGQWSTRRLYYIEKEFEIEPVTVHFTDHLTKLNCE